MIDDTKLCKCGELATLVHEVKLGAVKKVLALCSECTRALWEKLCNLDVGDE